MIIAELNSNLKMISKAFSHFHKAEAKAISLLDSKTLSCRLILSVCKTDFAFAKVWGVVPRTIPLQGKGNPAIPPFCKNGIQRTLAICNLLIGS